SACAMCLGRFVHNILQCSATELWDGSAAHAQRAQDGRILNPAGLPLCFKWQRPGGC
ncbi:hypothetical protein C8R48DRAFT_559474, partial [Suillus tomentosus]